MAGNLTLPAKFSDHAALKILVKEVYAIITVLFMLGGVYNAVLVPKPFVGLDPRHATCIFGRQLRRFNQDDHSHYDYEWTLKIQNSARYLIPSSPEKF